MLIYGWLLLGSISFALALVNLIRAARGKRRGRQILLSASLSCGGLALVCALQAINGWVRRWADSELLDVAPTLAVISCWAICLGIGLNLLALWLHTREK